MGFKDLFATMSSNFVVNRSSVPRLSNRSSDFSLATQKQAICEFSEITGDF